MGKKGEVLEKQYHLPQPHLIFHLQGKIKLPILSIVMLLKASNPLLRVFCLFFLYWGGYATSLIGMRN